MYVVPLNRPEGLGKLSMQSVIVSSLNNILLQCFDAYTGIIIKQWQSSVAVTT